MSSRPKGTGSVEVDGTFHWDIPNFSQLHPETAPKIETTRSPIFSLGQKDGQNLEWVTCVAGLGHEDYMGCILILGTDKKNKNAVADDKPTFISCSYKIGFGNKNNPFVVREFNCNSLNLRLSRLKGKSYHHFFLISDTHQFNVEQGNGSGFQLLIKKSGLYTRGEELLLEDTLRITIQMQFDLHDSSADFPPVLKDFSREKFSDFEIKCGESFFPCHKLILSSRSSVFNRMFESELEKALKGQIVIEDMEPAAVETLLKFIYTDQVNLPENCSLTELLHGAEKYDLDDLKNFCFDKMLDDLTMDNFGTLYVAAQIYNAGDRVKMIVREFYKKNLKEFMKNPNFRNIFNMNPNLNYPEFKG